MRNWRGLAAIAMAVAMLVGCNRAPQTDLGSQVDKIVASSGNQVITRINISNDPADLLVAMRTPTGEVIFDANGPLDRSPSEIPLGATRPDALDYAQLEDQWAQLTAVCSSEAVLSVMVGASGAVFTEALCDDELLTSTIDGVEPGPASIDLMSAGGIEQLMTEAAALLPLRGVYMFSLPGPASPRGDLARVDGGLWALADGSECGTVYLRAGQPNDEYPTHGFDCTSGGALATEDDVQELFDPATIDGQQVVEAMADAVAASGFDESEIGLYFYYRLTYKGARVLISTVDGGRYIHVIDGIE